MTEQVLSSTSSIDAIVWKTMPDGGECWVHDTACKLSRPIERIAILISGRGSNMAALLEAQSEGRFHHAQVVLVISNQPEALGLRTASRAGIKTWAFSPKAYASREATDEAIQATLKAHDIDFVILAGYSRILTPILTNPWEHRMINMHPSLLPKFGGVGMLGHKVHEAVLASGTETHSGCSVHWVTDLVDGGHLLGQRRCPVLTNDTPETLAKRVLTQEHLLFPEVLATLIEHSVPS
ncbi:MAG: phosphoribosylglycinamide formyltransferase [Vampirovibrionales bacterium]